MTQKKCTKCNFVKPIESFRFLKASNRFMSECKECERERQRGNKKPTRRDLAVREVAVLCSMFGTDILKDAVDYLEGNNL